jgi:hypothetical protein
MSRICPDVERLLAGEESSLRALRYDGPAYFSSDVWISPETPRLSLTGAAMMALSWAVILALCGLCLYRLIREESAHKSHPHEPTPEDSAL